MPLPNFKPFCNTNRSDNSIVLHQNSADFDRKSIHFSVDQSIVVAEMDRPIMCLEIDSVYVAASQILSHSPKANHKIIETRNNIVWCLFECQSACELIYGCLICLYNDIIHTLMTTLSQKSWSCGIGSKWACVPPKPRPAPPSSSWLLNLGNDLWMEIECKQNKKNYSTRTETNDQISLRQTREQEKIVIWFIYFAWII